MHPPIKYTGVDAEYKGMKVNVPIPVFDTVLQYQDKEVRLSILLDTGSNGTMLFPQCVKVVDGGFIPEGQESPFTPVIKRFGEMEINSEKRMRLDYESMAPEPPQTPLTSGIVGSDFLRDYVLHINYTKSEFSLLKEKPEPLPFSCKFSFDNEKGFWFLHPIVLGVELKLLFDTGNGGALVLFERGFSKLPQDHYKASGREYAHGAFGAIYYYDTYEEIEMELAFSEELNLKTGFGVMEHHAVIDESLAPYDGILGNQVFAGRQIIIDYVAQTFSFS